MYIIATIFLYELAEFFFSPFFSIASNLQSWKITHAEGTFLAVRFPRYFYRSELVGQSSIPIRKPVTLLSMSTAIFFIFPFFFSPFFPHLPRFQPPLPRRLISFPLSFPRHSTTGEEAASWSSQSKRVFVRHSNSSANIYSICPSFSLSLGGHSTKVRHCHATTLFESSRARTGEKAKKEELVRLSVCLVIIVGSESWWILVPRVLFVYPYTMRHGKYFDETFFLSIRR